MQLPVPVTIEDAQGVRRVAKAMVDTGASFSILGRNFATETLNLEVPPPNLSVSLDTAGGTVRGGVTLGEIRLRFVRFPERCFTLLCLFRDQPDTVPPLLGLHNVIDLMTIRFDGTSLPRTGPPHPEDGFMGSMQFEFPE